MKTLNLILAGLLLTIFFELGDSVAAESSATTQTVSGGGVAAKVTFLNLKSGDEPRFLIVLDTHSANLDGYDFKTLGVLRDDSGKVYSPTAVENKGSGHHREATVSFPKLSQEARRVELVIKDVAGVKDRVFSWTVD